MKSFCKKNSLELMIIIHENDSTWNPLEMENFWNILEFLDFLRIYVEISIITQQ